MLALHLCALLLIKFVDTGPVALRPAAIAATHIVTAVPLDPEAPVRFRVLESLRGRLKPGAVVALTNVRADEVRTFDPVVLPTGGQRPRHITHALLFLGADGRTIVEGGLRCWTDDRRLLGPAREGAKPILTVRPGIDWHTMLDQVRADCRSLAELDAARGMARPERRAAGLLSWARRHGRQFGYLALWEFGSGWGHLERAVFEEALAAGSIEQGWEAVRLHAELHRDDLPRLTRVPFGTPAGRAFLLDRATAAPLAGDRVRAVALLGEPVLFPATQAEQEGLIDRLAPLLPAANEPMRLALAVALRALSAPEDASRRTSRALPLLVAAYKGEARPAVREELAETVRVVGGPGYWRELTGLPYGTLVTLANLGVDEAHVRFWVRLRSAGARVTEQPTVVLERLGLLGLAVETKRLPLEAGNLPRPWAEGWDGADLLLSWVPLEGLGPGNWRITLQGTIGRDRQKWTSLPERFVVPAGPRPPTRRPPRLRY